MQPKSGYKTITPIELSNGLYAFKSKLITFRALRVYVGCFALVAIREAASRSRQKNRKKDTSIPSYRISELKRLTGAPEIEIRRDLAALKRAGLLSFSQSEIKINKSPLPGSEVILGELSGKRSDRRPIPVPRSVIRFLAACTKPALLKTLLAYILRGLTIDRETGEVRGKGTVKLSWIAKTFQISERAANYARKELISLGLISKDTGSFQKKLNRDGAYFLFNLSWIASINLSWIASNTRVLKEVGKAQFAPLVPKTCVEFAPPYKDKKTPYGSKNQKALGAAPKPTGFCKTKKAKKENPKIYDVKPEDLGNFSRVEELYFQAVKRNLIEPTEAGAINFLAAAVRARSVSGDAPRIFMGIIKQKLWKNITQGDEDRALVALKRYRAEDPERFRYQGEGKENKLRYAA